MDLQVGDRVVWEYVAQDVAGEEYVERECGTITEMDYGNGLCYVRMDDDEVETCFEYDDWHELIRVEVGA